MHFLVSSQYLTVSQDNDQLKSTHTRLKGQPRLREQTETMFVFGRLNWKITPLSKYAFHLRFKCRSFDRKRVLHILKIIASHP